MVRMNTKIVVPALTRTGRQSDKADVTDRESRIVIENENAEREAKTARLRSARLKAKAEAAPMSMTRKSKKKSAPKR